MQTSLRSVLAGAAAFLATGAMVSAMAQNTQVHILTVQLPGGGVEQIRYTGDVAPRVVLVPTPAIVATPVQPMFTPDPFAALERISAILNQQAATMLHQAESMPATLPGLPQGASGYSFVSTMSGNGVCSRSVRITYTGGNAQPQVVSSTSGDCGSEHGAPSPTNATVPLPTRHTAPGTIEVRATSPMDQPARQVAWNR